nr:hypothetical protein [Succinivibrionaceae bacterium]
ASATARQAATVAARAPVGARHAPLPMGTRSIPEPAAMTMLEKQKGEDLFNQIRKELQSINQGKPAGAMKFSFGDHQGETTNFRVSGKSHDIVLIGSSTGGPLALRDIIPNLPRLNVPVLVVQHMPASFTSTFADRLHRASELEVVEAKDGDILAPGVCYIAPGGMQMILERVGVKNRVRIFNKTPDLVYSPCVDVTFASAAKIFGGKALAMILTGMGSDGCHGCKLLHDRGSVVWAQNEETSVVYGMPQAVVNTGIADQVIPLDKIAGCIRSEFKM